MKSFKDLYRRNAVKMRKVYRKFMRRTKPYWIVYTTNKSPRIVDIQNVYSQRA
jgi:hypothetical protein